MVSRVALRLPFRAQRSIDVREHFTGKNLQAAVSGTSVSSSNAGESKIILEVIFSLFRTFVFGIPLDYPQKSGELYMSGACSYV